MAKDQDTKKIIEIPREVAEKEINSWLDYKRIRSKKREKYKTTIENLIDAMEEGILVYNPETHELTQKLIWPIEELQISELVHKPRLISDQIDKSMKGADADDGTARIKAYIKGSTGINSMTMKRLDSNDFNLSADLIVFFLT
jgi:hypothetical protein